MADVDDEPTGTRPDPPIGACKVEFEGTYLGTSWAVIHWLLTTATLPTIDDQALLAEEMQDLFQANLAHWSNGACHFTTTRTTVYLGASTNQKKSYVEDAVGGSGGSPLPAQVSLLIDWSCTDGRRGGKPRSYLPGVDSTLVTESYLIAASSLAGIATQAAAYIAGVNALTFSSIASVTFGAMSFVDAGAYRSAPTFFPITDGFPRAVLATQRRRVDRQA